MKYLLPIICIVAIICSCTKNEKTKIVYPKNRNKNITELQKDSTLIKIADLPVLIDSTDYLIHPIGDFKLIDNRGKSIYKSASRNSQSLSISNSNHSKIYGNLSNVKFQHLDSNTLKPLTDKHIKITSISFLRGLFNTTKKQLLIYEIIDKDTNKDNKLDTSDINSLYISNIDGSNFKKITKTNRELIDWKVILPTNKLYFKSIEDTNMDGDFNAKDQIYYSYVNLDTDNLKPINYNPKQ